MDQRKLFRKAALDKMASPERLDEMMEVTAPYGWAAATAIGLLLLGAVLWGIFGSIAIKVQGQGILIRGEAVLAVASGSTGRVETIEVRPGDIVAEGDVVALVNQPDLALRIDNTREERDSLLAQDEEQSIAESRILSQLESQKRELQAKLVNQQQMLRRGLVTRGTVLSTQSQLSSIDQNIARQEATSGERTNRIAAVQRELEELESQMDSSARVESPYAGRVLELMIDPGNMISPGMRLLTLEALEGPVDAVMFIPAGDGKKVRPGMSVRVSPSTVRSEEYGFILGEVKSVSDYPVTSAGVARVLRNDRLVASLTGEGAPIEVIATLHRSESTESGFEWSSSGGPPSKVFTGTICAGSVIVERKRPISYVLPVFRSG